MEKIIKLYDLTVEMEIALQTVIVILIPLIGILI